MTNLGRRLPLSPLARVFCEMMVRVLEVGQDAVEGRSIVVGPRDYAERTRRGSCAPINILRIRGVEAPVLEHRSPAMERIGRVRSGDLLSGNPRLRSVGAILHEDRELALDHVRCVRHGRTVLNASRIQRRSDGGVHWVCDTDDPVRDAGSRAQGMDGFGHVVTEESESQDRLRVLVAELQHRSRNLMSVVRSLTDRTLASSASLPDFQDRIRDRLNALARVNGLLSRLDDSGRLTFRELILTELMAHGVADTESPGSQVKLRGPTGIRLRSSTVQTLALGLHELATNALKHGALSRPEGRLEVTWGLLDGPNGVSSLWVDWRESGVPIPVLCPDDEPFTAPHRGYGRELIERALPYELKAETYYQLTPDGVRCTITLPVSSTMNMNDPAAEKLDA